MPETIVRPDFSPMPANILAMTDIGSETENHPWAEMLT